jgi:hypothetical protein
MAEGSTDQKVPKQVDVGAFLAEQGVSVASYDPETFTATVKNADGKEGKFDVGGWIKSAGVDPSLVKDIKFNDPDSPIEENALGFKDRTLIAAIKNPADQIKYLQSVYGDENVRAISGGVSVKDSGIWKRAESGFLGELAAESPIIAASAVGAAKWGAAGALAGSAVPGIGTVAGGIVGGAVGAGLAAFAAKGVLEAGMQQLGIKTKQDSEQALKEMGKTAAEYAGWQLAFGAAGAAAKAAWKGPGGRMFAGALEKITGTPADDWMVTFGMDGAAKQVTKSLALDDKAAKAALKQGTFQGVLPSQKNLAVTARDTLDDLQRVASKNYTDVMSSLEKAGVTQNARVNVQSLTEGFETQLKSAGLLDDAGQWLSKAKAEKTGVTQVVFDSKSQNLLRTVYRNVKGLSSNGELPFEAVKKNRQLLDEVIQSSNAFANPDALTPTARKAVMSLRSA